MQYVIRHEDKFGCVSEVISALGNYLTASTWQRSDNLHDISLIGERCFSLDSFADAQAFADSIHPYADEMGEIMPYRCPAIISHDLEWS